MKDKRGGTPDKCTPEGLFWTFLFDKVRVRFLPSKRTPVYIVEFSVDSRAGEGEGLLIIVFLRVYFDVFQQSSCLLGGRGRGDRNGTRNFDPKVTF